MIRGKKKESHSPSIWSLKRIFFIRRQNVWTVVERTVNMIRPESLSTTEVPRERKKKERGDYVSDAMLKGELQSGDIARMDIDDMGDVICTKVKPEEVEPEEIEIVYSRVVDEV